MTDPIFIVAEISKNWWRDGVEVVPGSGLLSEQFEKVINVNRERGYALASWGLHRLMVGTDELNETIVAVFRRDSEARQ
jgi:hypothetical protein